MERWLGVSLADCSIGLALDDLILAGPSLSAWRTATTSALGQERAQSVGSTGAAQDE
jgi:hypothetical protein